MSSKSVYLWWMQRVSGLLLLPMPFILLAFSVMDSVRFWGAAVGFCFLLSAFYHGVLGVQVVLEDYVHCVWLRSFLITFLRLFSVFTVVAVSFLSLQFVNQL